MSSTADGAIPGLQIVTPPMLPTFRRAWQRRCNGMLVGRALDRALPSDRGDCVVLTTLPIAAALSGSLPPAPWIYYCVDDFSRWPGLDGALMDDLERRLVAFADRAIAASPVLSERLAALGARPVLLTHGVDLEHWRPMRSGDSVAGVPQWALALERPIVLFWGLIDRRLDTDWLRAASAAAGSLVLVGPQQEHDPSIASLPNVVLPGPLPYAALPALAAHADALVMPYADLPVTRAMQPLKLKEYLATDRPAILASLPSTRQWADAADVVGSAEELAQAIRLRARTGAPEPQLRARRRLEQESWERKAHELEAIVLDCLRGRR